MPTNGRKDRLRSIKKIKRYQEEKMKKCGQCKHLFNGLCEQHKTHAHKDQSACFLFVMDGTK